MAFSIADRIKETTATTGTGTYTLAGAVDGFESFASIGDGNTTYYVCTDGTDFEVGIGTYTASGTTLARTTILQSTNADAAVSWAAGDKDVFVSLPAEKAVVEDDAGATNINNLVVTGSHDLRVNSAIPAGINCVVAIGRCTLTCPTLSINAKGSVAIGDCALFCGASDSAVAIGAAAGYYNTIYDSVSIGKSANYCGGACIAIGRLAAYATTSPTALGLIAIGNSAGQCATCACYAVLIGDYAGQNLNSAGFRAVAIGQDAARYRCGFFDSVAIGYRAAFCSTGNNSSCSNVFIGRNAGCGRYGINLVAIGTGAMQSVNTSLISNNVAVGYYSQYFVCRGGHVTVGADAGMCMLGNSYENTYFGYKAGSSVHCNSSNNIAIGVRSGTCTCAGGYCGLKDINTTCCNLIVMGNCTHSCALIKVGWTTVSDCRDKSCVCDIPHGLDFVRALSPKEYRFKIKGRYKDDVEDKKRYGFLAQDVLTLEGDNPVIINDENPDLLVYEESHMVPVLVNAIKELADKVQTLEELVNA